jgi:hypothetical protein
MPAKDGQYRHLGFVSQAISRIGAVLFHLIHAQGLHAGDENVSC